MGLNTTGTPKTSSAHNRIGICARDEHRRSESSCSDKRDDDYTH
jgi:hypothetical protein